jgi:hypothetical protein
MRGAVVLAGLAGLTGLVVLAGCAGGGGPAGGPDGGSGSGSAAPANRAGAVRGPEAARATAQTEFGLLAGGDYGGAWDLWSDTAKAAIGRADFVALNTACPRRGVPVEVVTVRLLDDSDVDVDWKRGTQTGSARLVYAGGSWRYQPDQSTLDTYRSGVDSAVTRLRVAGQC